MLKGPEQEKAVTTTTKKKVVPSKPNQEKAATTTVKKRVVPCKSNKVINKTLLDFLGKYETKREHERVTLVPDPDDKGKWLAYHPNNPAVKFSPTGYYAYTTKLDETNPEHPEGKKIVAWPISGHNDTFHIGLSSFSEKLAYAGEVLFSRKKPGNLVHFDSASGTYNPKEQHKEQAGFPVEKYRKPDFPF